MLFVEVCCFQVSSSIYMLVNSVLNMPILPLLVFLFKSNILHLSCMYVSQVTLYYIFQLLHRSLLQQVIAVLSNEQEI